jgi:hypothetical protein
VNAFRSLRHQIIAALALTQDSDLDFPRRVGQIQAQAALAYLLDLLV